MSEAQEISGTGLIVAAYGDQANAQRVFESLILLDPDEGTVVGMAALVHKDLESKVHFKETGDTKTGEGIGLGGLGGAFIGLLAGPGGVAVGAAAGALMGGLSAVKDAGFDDDSLRAIGGALLPGSGAVVATTSVDAVRQIRKVAPPGLLLLHARDIAATIQQRLESGEDMLVTMTVADDGISVMEVTASPAELTVFGIAVSGESASADTGGGA